MKTPLGRVRHLGSARGGTGAFWLQRLTAAANAILATGFVVVMLATVGKPHAEAVAVLGSPPVAALLVLLFVSVAVHMRIGMHEILADYVDGERLKILLSAANTFFAVAFAVVAAIAVLTLAVGG
jgi:succinate dehydrogenase / fumarate reductase membrane anchor subunit